MRVLVDASVLLRLRDPKSVHYSDCHTLLKPEVAERHELCLCAQSIIEYWVVATRPLAQNGLELTTEEASGDLLALRRFLPNVPEPPDVADRWLRLVTRHRACRVSRRMTRGLPC
jgi:predicted nucleic acid-binding protein